ncbi:extracellular solute-binding protein [Pseudonocardia alni]|uniref:extracellular solute-binding protein n=1 Tax=Pseudonocardia alni TaxID=33907 RepID=UPI0033D40F8F
MSTSLSRRSFLRGTLLAAGATAGASVLAACGGGATAASAGGTVAFADWGGSVREARKKAFLDPFMAQKGAQVAFADADPARFVSMAERGRSQWDTIDADGFLHVDWQRKGLLRELPASVRKADLVPAHCQSFAGGGYSTSFVVTYRKSAFPGGAPQSWADFWDTEKFPGKRGFPGTYLSTVEPALLADGVDPAKLFPLDFDRGLRKLDQLRSSLTIYESYGQGQQALQSRTVDISLLPNGRAFPLLADDDIAITWEQNIYYPWTSAPVPNGAPNPALMFELVDFMNQPENQAEFARLCGYGPTVAAAFDLLDDSLNANLPGSPVNLPKSVVIDADALAAQTEEYSARYSAWLARA